MKTARTEPLIPDELKSQYCVAGISFLTTELDTALTFAQVALGTKNNPAKKIRNRSNARKAYDTAVAMSRYLQITEADVQKLEPKRCAAQRALEGLGESFS